MKNEDPILKEKGVLAGDAISRLSSIEDKNLKVIGGYLETVWRVKAIRAKNVPVDKIIENTKAIFSDDDFRLKDSLWIQHCSSSIRELIMDLNIPEDFICAYKNLPKPTQDDGSPFPVYYNIRQYEKFFHATSHFRSGSQLQLAREILGDPKIEIVDGEIFERITTQFLLELYDLFSQHCMKEKRPAK